MCTFTLRLSLYLHLWETWSTSRSHYPEQRISVFKNSKGNKLDVADYRRPQKEQDKTITKQNVPHSVLSAPHTRETVLNLNTAHNLSIKHCSNEM